MSSSNKSRLGLRLNPLSHRGQLETTQTPSRNFRFKKKVLQTQQNWCGSTLLESPLNPESIQFACARTKTGSFGTGQMKTNQDSHFSIANLDGTGKNLYGVCDGHGANGHQASQHVSQNMPQILQKRLKHLFDRHNQIQLKFLKDSLYQTFCQVERDLVLGLDIDVSLSGTTCNLVLLWGNQLWCANVGDSRSVFFSRNKNSQWTFRDLSIDHKPSRQCEFKRIQKYKGRVFEATYDGVRAGPLRVWLPDQELPGLAMSRSLGDRLAKRAGVSYEPEITHTHLTEPGFVVMGTDGFWDQVDNQTIIRLLSRFEAPQNQKECSKIADSLMNYVVNEWQKQQQGMDDITIQLLYVDLPKQGSLNHQISPYRCNASLKGLGSPIERYEQTSHQKINWDGLCL